ncbi:hypothetical protein L1286_11160 [Pseudoalteromonas sp. SMS1]|uniref:hypothetical protein n=1 Tax=Pseudoalteromonas sp. SMS1 TaxID=2908894 RepID=UPI001F276C44|nr:hypothetical protein [Pseudoalteromonas sp. SMS1]MCF2858031.1 hypothetical protein [Pseudoalteromonas sp. SMS1]
MLSELKTKSKRESEKITCIAGYIPTSADSQNGPGKGSHYKTANPQLVWPSGQNPQPEVKCVMQDIRDNGGDIGKIASLASDTKIKGMSEVHNAHQVKKNWGGTGGKANIAHWTKEFENEIWVEKDRNLNELKKTVVAKNLENGLELKQQANGSDIENAAHIDVEYNVNFYSEAEAKALFPNSDAVEDTDYNTLIKLVTYLAKSSSFKVESDYENGNMKLEDSANYTFSENKIFIV